MEEIDETSTLVRLRWAPFVFLLMIAMYLSGPKLGLEIWYDEAYTLEHFASGTLSDAFCYYPAPNNHVLYSALLGQYIMIFDGNPATFTLRLFPWMCFLCATIVLFIIGRRVGGEAFGFFLGALFSASHVALNFSTQLRGYSVSWVPVTFALLAFVSLQNAFSRRWLILLGGAGAIAVGLVPTNLVVMGILSACAIVDWLFCRDRSRAIIMIVSIAGPCLGFLFYLGVISDFITITSMFDNGLTASGVYCDLLHYSLRDLWWLLPFALVGGILACRNCTNRSDKAVFSASVRGLTYCISCLAVPAVALAILVHPPFARNFVPALPLFMFSFGVLCRTVLDRFPWGKAIMLFAGSLLLLLAAYREQDNAGYTKRYAIGDRPQTLYDLYYQNEFYPSSVIAEIAEQKKDMRTIFLADRSDLYALRFSMAVNKLSKIKLICVADDSRQLSEEEFRKTRGRFILISRNQDGANLICKNVNITELPVLIKDTGYYKVYLVDYSKPKP